MSWDFCYGEGCDDESITAEDQDNDPNTPSFKDWLDCWVMTEGTCEEYDPAGVYQSCYKEEEKCGNISWDFCYGYGCDEDEEKPADDQYTKFSEWLECYEAALGLVAIGFSISWDDIECGPRHAEYYDCYWNNTGCQDPWWFNCFWSGEDCDKVIRIKDSDDISANYVEGYYDGFVEGYVDGVIDT